MARPNLAALASAIYNPGLSDCSLNTRKSMIDPSDDILEDYRNIVRNFPTKNMAEGAIYNPRECATDDAITGINNAKGSLQKTFDEIAAAGRPKVSAGGIPTYTPSNDDKNLFEEWAAKFPEILGKLSQAEQVLNNFKTHTNMLIANLAGCIGLAQASAGLQAKLFNLVDPCLNFGDFFGSILGKGANFIAKIQNQIESLILLIASTVKDELLGELFDKIDAIAASVGKLLTLVLDEVDKLAAALLEAGRLGLSNLLCFLPSDPCAASLLAEIATPALRKVLNI
jgi:hypothetical protein